MEEYRTHFGWSWPNRNSRHEGDINLRRGMSSQRPWYGTCLAFACALAATSATAQVESPRSAGILQRALEALGVESPYAKLTPAQFAVRLYPISVYTGERDALGRLLEAEIDLVASRLLARRLAAARGVMPPKSPAGWDAMLAAFRATIELVAHRHFQERDAVLRRAGLEERPLYRKTYEQLVLQPKDRGNIQFADGSSARASGNQVADIPQILAFHERAAAAKWRLLWPELRAYAARLAAYQHRIATDPDLGSDRAPERRAAALVQRIGGRTIGMAEWMRLRENRLHYTLGGLHRFGYPLGTMLASSGEAPTMTIGEGASGAITIASQEGGFVYIFLDSAWDADLSRRLSGRELRQIDDALTAEYDAKKDRWFAPLELEWDAHLSISRKIQTHQEMRELFVRFANDAAAAGDAVWAEWGGSLNVEVPTPNPVPPPRGTYGGPSR